MRAQGWDVKDPKPGQPGIGYHVPSAQAAAADQALQDCYDEKGELKGPEITDAFIRGEYAWVGNVVKCIRKLGFDAPDLPSYESYRYQLKFPDQVPDPWTPYPQIPDPAESPAEYDKIMAACPSEPGM